MRDLAVLTFMTLDGVMQSPAQTKEDLSGGFTHGGWAADYWEEVMAQVRDEAMAQPYDLLLGRKTYESFAAHFQNDDGNPHAEKMNKATKYVVTSTLNELEWMNSVPVSGDIATEISRLKESDGPLLQVHGSSELIQTLLVHDLIDEFRLWTFPLLTGAGKRLFGQKTVSRDLQLVKTSSTSNGVVMSIYRRG